MSSAPAGESRQSDVTDRRTSTIIVLLLFAAAGLCLAAWWTLYVAPTADNFISAPLHSVLVAN